MTVMFLLSKTVNIYYTHNLIPFMTSIISLYLCKKYIFSDIRKQCYLPLLLVLNANTYLKYDFQDNFVLKKFLKEVVSTMIDTAQKMKFSIKDFFSKCDQIHSFLRIWSHLLKKSLMKNFIFCAV